MIIIMKTPRANGSYPPLQDWSNPIPPDTHYQIKEGLDENAKLKNDLSEAKREIFKLQNHKA